MNCQVHQKGSDALINLTVSKGIVQILEGFYISNVQALTREPTQG